MAKAKIQKYLTIQQAIEQDPKSPLYLLNISEESELTDYMAGDVYLSARSDGDIIPIKVPKTWLPVEVTTMAPRDAILKSRFFMNAVNNGLVKIITREYAEELTGSEGADDERARMAAMDARMRAATSNRKVVPEKGKTLDTSEAETTELPIQFRVKVTAMNEMSEKEAMVELRGMRRLSEDRARYMIENLTHKRIVAWLKDKLENTEDA